MQETMENWLIRNGQTARLRELLWDPPALAALLRNKGFSEIEDLGPVEIAQRYLQSPRGEKRDLVSAHVLRARKL